MTTTPIFIISLPQSKERRRQLSAQLSALKLDYEITDAVDGASLELETLTPRLATTDIKKLHGGKGLTRGEIGCYLSHYKLWQRMTNEHIERAIIMEDDAVCYDDFVEVLNALLTTGWRWDMVRLSSYTIDKYITRGKRGGFAKWWNGYLMESRVERKLCPVSPGRFLVRHHRPTTDTTAYILTRKAAETLLQHCAVINEPIDIAYTKWWQTNLHFLAVHPPVVSQLKSDSTIETARATHTKKARTGLQSIPNQITRRRQRTRDRRRCRAWNLRNPPESKAPGFPNR